jgi:hypothetical protein
MVIPLNLLTISCIASAGVLPAEEAVRRSLNTQEMSPASSAQNMAAEMLPYFRVLNSLIIPIVTLGTFTCLSDP